MEIVLLLEENSEKQNIVDITMKALMRRSSEAIFDLAGIKLKSLPVLLEDTSISIPELRADQVFLIGEKGDPERGAIYMEYQLHMRIDALPTPLTVSDLHGVSASS